MKPSSLISSLSIAVVLLATTVSSAQVIRGKTKSAETAVDTSARETVRERSLVKSDGIPVEYADAMANVCDTVSRYLQQSFNLDVPEKVTLLAELKKGLRTAISNNGVDEIRLALERLDQLKSPQSSRVYNVYAIASEIADLAMKKTLKKPDWMTDDAWDGLRYFLASSAVDQLNVAYSRKLWPDSADYSAEGMSLFHARVKSGNSASFVRAAGEWESLASDFGGATIGSLLREFGKAGAEKNAARSAVKALQPGGLPRTRSNLQRWFSKFEPMLVQSTGRSSASRRSKSSVRLSGKPELLKNDDGSGSLQILTEDAAPAALFEVETGEWRLTRVEVFAAVNSTTRLSGDVAKIWLCDREMKKLQSWPVQARQLKTDGGWAKIRLDYPAVSGQFVICVEPLMLDAVTFKVGVDDSSKGHSAVGRVGGAFRPFSAGEWMIRVEADTDRTSNPLLWRP